MGKNQRAKRNEMFSEYCLHKECGSYMEQLEDMTEKFEFQQKEARDIIQKYYERSNNYPTSDVDLIRLREQARAYLEATNERERTN